ncbi:hypothetical protein CDAR_564741 [Caerostris darwini]|uniref:Uncharacterized protein n=1 Tax=Caerostris darwini TaxID=1538125 RepID=A0AAV4NZZ5_9ARAC|nr:hypothetical protein CDAR_564741 [Caerostris darwini]
MGRGHDDVGINGMKAPMLVHRLEKSAQQLVDCHPLNEKAWQPPLSLRKVLFRLYRWGCQVRLEKFPLQVWFTDTYAAIPSNIGTGKHYYLG